MSQASMIEPPMIVATESLTMAKIRAKIPRARIQAEMGPLVQELIGAITRQNVAITGPWFTHHFHRPAEFFDFEVCMPVASIVRAEGRMQPGEWPAMNVVRTLYRGPYQGLPGAWGELMAWIEARGVEITSELWERYLVNPQSDANPDHWLTELNLPLRRETAVV